MASFRSQIGTQIAAPTAAVNLSHEALPSQRRMRYDADPEPRYLPLIADKSRPSITSTTNRARCFSGNHSSTDGGNKKPVCRSIVRKLLIASRPS